MEIAPLRDRYYGDLAHSYDKHRKHTKNWRRENEVVEDYLGRLPCESTLLDVPVGTGRFAEFYKRFSLRVTGVDASQDMLAGATAKGQAEGLDWRLEQGNIKALSFPDGAFDTVVCIRFLNWVESADLSSIIGELSRVTRDQAILGVQIYVPIRDIHFFSRRGFRRSVLQAKRRFYMARARREFVYHPQRTFADALSSNQLTIEEKALIEERKDGIDYHIYRLRKRC